MFSRAGWATLSIPLLAGLVRTQRDTETERERDGRKQQGFHPPHKYIVLKGRGGEEQLRSILDKNSSK